MPPLLIILNYFVKFNTKNLLKIKFKGLSIILHKNVDTMQRN